MGLASWGDTPLAAHFGAQYPLSPHLIHLYVSRKQLNAPAAPHTSRITIQQAQVMAHADAASSPSLLLQKPREAACGWNVKGGQQQQRRMCFWLIAEADRKGVSLLDRRRQPTWWAECAL
jgi:hypothetical protein